MSRMCPAMDCETLRKVGQSWVVETAGQRHSKSRSPERRDGRDQTHNPPVGGLSAPRPTRKSPGQGPCWLWKEESEVDASRIGPATVTSYPRDSVITHVKLGRATGVDATRLGGKGSGSKGSAILHHPGLARRRRDQRVFGPGRSEIAKAVAVPATCHRAPRAPGGGHLPRSEPPARAPELASYCVHPPGGSRRSAIEGRGPSPRVGHPGRVAPAGLTRCQRVAMLVSSGRQERRGPV